MRGRVEAAECLLEAPPKIGVLLGGTPKVEKGCLEGGKGDGEFRHPPQKIMRMEAESKGGGSPLRVGELKLQTGVGTLTPVKL